MLNSPVLPGSLADLTPEWLTEALRASTPLGAGYVTSVDSTAVGDGNGLMSQVARLRLSYDAPRPGVPETLIAKLPPEDPGSHSVGVELRFFEREARFYEDLARHTAIRAAQCYFTRYEPADGRFLTLLEDLSGARPGDIGAGCGLDDGIAAMRSLAGLHASWWESTALTELLWLQTHKGHIDAMLSMLDEVWPSFLSRFGDRLSEQELRALKSVHGLLSRSPNFLSEAPTTLLHGDYKLDNMFFAGDGDVVAFDWGLVMAGPPGFDVASFLGLNLEPDDRRRDESDLIHSYVDALAAHGVRDYAFDRCMADYEAHLAGLLPQLIAAGGKATFADDEAMQRYATGLRRVLAAVRDHDVLEKLQPDENG